VVTTAALFAVVAGLGRLDSAVDDAERVDQIRALEELKAAAAAAQARVTAAFAASQREAQRAAELPAERVGRGIASQVGLARRESPARAARYTGWAAILVGELPETLAALTRGEITEWRAMLVARETVWLSREHRAAVDAALAGRLGTLGDAGVVAEARRLGYRLDPHGYLSRIGAAEAERRVTLRPAPEVMARLTALLPVAQGVAAWAALRRDAEQARAAGDPRTLGRVMADTLVARLTGQAGADAVPVEVALVMTDRALFGVDAAGGPATAARARRDAGADEPAELLGHGPIPAALARRLVRAPEDTTAVWLRRLYRDPETGALVGMDRERRRFDGGLRRFLVLRDRTCRTPWCEAPVRHADHVIPAEDGGATSAENGQGLCAACNHAKQAPGWRAVPDPGGAGRGVTTTTPTGHAYTSRAPDPPGGSPPRGDPVAVDPPERACPSRGENEGIALPSTDAA
jgi:hypothetical protein